MAKGFLRSIKKGDRVFLPNVMFDVGANVGHMSELMTSAYPSASVYAFEPAPSTHGRLEKRFRDSQNVKIFQIALDESAGKAEFTDKPMSTGNHIVTSSDEPNGAATVSVEKITGDEFCATHSIRNIDFLKVDTEGFDLNVLIGFTKMLKEGQIKYLQVECTTNYENHLHVNLEKFMRFLHPFGYRLFGLFDYSRYIYKTRQPMEGIWFCNAVFVREFQNARLRTGGHNFA